MLFWSISISSFWVSTYVMECGRIFHANDSSFHWWFCMTERERIFNLPASTIKRSGASVWRNFHCLLQNHPERVLTFLIINRENWVMNELRIALRRVRAIYERRWKSFIDVKFSYNSHWCTRRRCEMSTMIAH